MVLASTAIEILPNQPTLSARFLPYLLSGALIGGGFLLWARPDNRPLVDVAGELFARRGVLVAIVFVLYAVTFRHVDFRLGTWAFVLFTMWVLGARRPAELVLVPIVVSAVVYVSFRYGFTVLLPTWT